MVSGRGNFKQIYTKSSQRLRREIKKVEIGQKEKEIISGKTESMNWSDEVKTFRNQTKCCWHLGCEAACTICKLVLIFAGKPHQAVGKKNVTSIAGCSRSAVSDWSFAAEAPAWRVSCRRGSEDLLTGRSEMGPLTVWFTGGVFCHLIIVRPLCSLVVA